MKGSFKRSLKGSFKSSFEGSGRRVQGLGLSGCRVQPFFWGLGLGLQGLGLRDG